MSPLLFIIVIGLLLCLQLVHTFHINNSLKRHVTKLTKTLNMHFDEAINGNSQLKSNHLKRDRYLATNRFKVRGNKEAQFEKRWADRKSRLSQLEGFRLFSLFRRIEDSSEIAKLSASLNSLTTENDAYNYISFTIWESKDNFDSWRTGEAFKEAHGGGSIIDFMKLIGTALFIIDGKPTPAFYDCISYQPSVKPATRSLVSRYVNNEGWRSVKTDGKNILNPEIFLTQYKYKVTDSYEFEKMMSSEINSIATTETLGLIISTLLRRDANKADDGYNYIVSLIWINREAYTTFNQSKSIQLTAITSDNAALYQGAPVQAFYEGKLTLISQDEFKTSANVASFANTENEMNIVNQ